MDELVVEIKVDGAVLGSVNPKTLKARAQFDLEDAFASPRSTYAMVEWLVTYAGADRDKVIDVLSDMPLQAIMDMAMEISRTLGEAVEVPKRSARR